MRNKFFEKLKDFKEESNRVEAEESHPASQMLKEIKPSSSRGKIKSTSRSNQEEFIKDMIVKRSKSIYSSQMPIFTRKVSTNRSVCFEIHSRPYTPAFM